MDRDRWLGLGLVALGTATALVAQAANPFPGPPLYDGVIVVEPYLWLDPPEGYPEGATGAKQSIGVSAARNENVVVGTPEQPPQAQLIGVRGSMQLPAGATSILVTITPLARPAPEPLDGYIDGNVYRFAVTDQAGRMVTPKAHTSVSIILRPADPTLSEATIERFDGVAWQPLGTTPDLAAAFVTIVSEFGDFAVVVNGVSPYGTPVPSATATSTGASAAPLPTVAPGAGSPAPSPGDQNGVPVDSAVAGIAAVGLILAIAAVGLVLRQRRRDRVGRTGWSR